MTMRVTIRGKTYESVKSAARAMGVKPCSIYSALERGEINNVGNGRGNHPNKRHNGGRKKVPVAIGGYNFPSIAAAARALGYDPQTLGNVLRRGKEKSRANVLRAAMALRAREEMEEAMRRKVASGSDRREK